MTATSRLVRAGALVSALAVTAGCGSSAHRSSTSSTAPGTTATTSASPGTTLAAYVGTGTVPKGEPDVNHDGKVVIGVLSPGDTHDHGYYESFVDEADAFAAEKGWQVVTIDKTPAAQAVQATRNLCRQHVDMVAIGASEIADALGAASEAECQGVFFYVNGATGAKQDGTFTVSTDNETQEGFASGVAAGLVMKASGAKKAGFITGPQVAFTTGFYKPWAAGIKSVLPDATTVVTYTGDLNDSAKAVEAFKAQQAQGIGLVYPYLGGSTYAVAALANQAGVPALTPGTDNCASTSPKFAISVIFSPGDYFAAALKDFAAGTLRLGVTRQWRMGLDPVPTVKICQPVGDQQQVLDQTIHDIGTGRLDLSKYASS